jgi:DNA mismatch endonuclease, patch repair protein
VIRDPALTSRIMSAVPSRNTKPELALRSSLWRRGLRYRLNSRLIGRPDVVFPGPRVVIFVDGDFWHGNAWRVRGLSSFDAQFRRINNADFWRAKIQRNMRRDEQVNAALSSAQWRVYRVFESRLRTEPEAVATEIECLVRGACS